MGMIRGISNGVQNIIKGLGFLTPVVDLGFRLYVANVFFRSGLNKYQSWDSTLFLFEYEYQVPFLPPEIAAILGTGAELILPVFLALGLATRFSGIALFIFNIIAVISYPALNEAGLKDHLYWGIMLLVPIFHGPGALSVDYLIKRWLWRSE